MSSKYKHGDIVPTAVLCARVKELIKAITARDSGRSIDREFDMRIPAELDRDADLVLSQIVRRIQQLEQDKAALEEYKMIVEAYDEIAESILIRAAVPKTLREILFALRPNLEKGDE